MKSKNDTIQQLLATATALLEEARRLSTHTPKPRQPRRRRPAPLPNPRATDQEIERGFAELRAHLASL
jgi:hypothetical protein